MSNTHAILVTNIKGGCGKSTISTNLAAAFAAGGLATTLADVDRQQSALGWLEVRPQEAAGIKGRDWRKEVSDLPKKTTRLVIDVPAGIRMKHVDALVDEADLVIVPVLPSIFDERSTLEFLEKLTKIKPLRKGQKAVLVVANRVRPRARATQRLVECLAQAGHAPTAMVHDRAIFTEAAAQGLGVFDPQLRRTEAAKSDLMPLLNAIERLA